MAFKIVEDPVSSWFPDELWFPDDGVVATLRDELFAAHVPDDSKVSGTLKLNTAGDNKIVKICNTCKKTVLDSVCEKCGKDDITEELTMVGDIDTGSKTLEGTLVGTLLDKFLGFPLEGALAAMKEDPRSLRQSVFKSRGKCSFELNHGRQIIAFERQ